MKSSAIWWAILFFLFVPSHCRAQNTGRVECARNDGYVYLYSSVATLDVRATLQCSEIVQVIGRYDNYFNVRDAQGDIGYVPMTSLVILKDQPGTGLPAPGAEAPARERIHYDNGPREVPAPARGGSTVFMLANNTPIRVKLTKTISSETAQTDDPVELEILEDHLVDGVPVLVKGAKVTGVIREAEAKKRFGKSGKLAFSISSVRLANGDSAPLRCYQSVSGFSNNSSDSVVPLASGKDVTIPQNSEFTALIDGDVRLTRESFLNPKDAPSAAPAAPTAASKSKP